MLAAQEPIDCGPSIIQKAKTTILEKFRTEFLKEFESVVDVDVCGTDYKVLELFDSFLQPYLLVD